ncbi:hypothetical protein [Alkalihalobacillus sp. LMS39]|uniref:hypothetical protein n=1 Tax=Alkalihalobacillus sp. LMS39 TaxID=2924032 RepID=UPI001FB261B3|nr:hypothetical protein [Alkalihalobacillus sp. LMS39]UOE95465.1 hypothetical protein MM271_07600 [Alkalihalobacillus sp. LMS39]
MAKGRKDVPNEGRDRKFVDIERMIDDGLGGGTVNMEEDSGLIEEARPLEDEEPPHHVDDEKA